MLNFIMLDQNNSDDIKAMSDLATSIVREHFDPLIGTKQNDYMISKFQTVEAITDQLAHGYQYYFVVLEARIIGFLAFYPKGKALYVSKFYLLKEERQKGYSHEMLAFIIDAAKAVGCESLELNVNKHNDACKAYDSLGFKVIRTEKNDIGCGFYMDDYVYEFQFTIIPNI